VKKKRKPYEPDAFDFLLMVMGIGLYALMIGMIVVWVVG